MADGQEPNSNAGQGQGDGSGQTSAGGGGGQTAPAAPSQNRQETFDAAYVASLRQEAASHRTKAAELEAQLKAKNDAELSELDRAKKEALEAKAAAEAAAAEVKVVRLQNAVTSKAVTLGVVDPEAAVRLLDLNQVTYDTAGNPLNIETLLKALLEQKPYLKKVVGNADAGSGSGGRTPGAQDMNSMIRHAAGRG